MQKRCVRPWLGDLRPNDAPRRIFGVESSAKTYRKKTGTLDRSVRYHSQGTSRIISGRLAADPQREPEASPRIAVKRVAAVFPRRLVVSAMIDMIATRIGNSSGALRV